MLIDFIIERKFHRVGRYKNVCCECVHVHRNQTSGQSSGEQWPLVASNGALTVQRKSGASTFTHTIVHSYHFFGEIVILS